MFNDVVAACVDAADISFPKTNSNKCKRPVPGWSENVHDYKKKALLWHSIWKSNGSPMHGFIADIRRKTRKDYHRAIK